MLALATLAKLLWEATLFVHLRDKQLGSLRRTALLLRGPLRRETGARFGLALAGGVFAPLVIGALVGGDGSVAAAVTVAALGWLALVAAELLERALFFRAAAPPRMPGGLH